MICDNEILRLYATKFCYNGHICFKLHLQSNHANVIDLYEYMCESYQSVTRYAHRDLPTRLNLTIQDYTTKNTQL